MTGWWFAAALAMALPLRAQNVSSRAKFEVASIRECKPSEPSSPLKSSPVRLSLGCWPLRRLILDAYELFAAGKIDPLQLLYSLTPMERAPAWIDSAHYSIDAKADAAQTLAMMRGPMMQTLLEDRFQLVAHFETREVPVYFMTVARGGPKLKPSTDASCTRADEANLEPNANPSGGDTCGTIRSVKKRSGEGVEIDGVTLAIFARLLHAGRPVIDRTGLSGVFDIYLDYPVAPPTAAVGVANDPGAPVIGLVREQLGLRLDPGKGPQDYLVIDRIARPTSN